MVILAACKPAAVSALVIALTIAVAAALVILASPEPAAVSALVIALTIAVAAALGPSSVTAALVILIPALGTIAVAALVVGETPCLSALVLGTASLTAAIGNLALALGHALLGTACKTRSGLAALAARCLGLLILDRSVLGTLGLSVLTLVGSLLRTVLLACLAVRRSLLEPLSRDPLALFYPFLGGLARRCLGTHRLYRLALTSKRLALARCPLTFRRLVLRTGASLTGPASPVSHGLRILGTVHCGDLFLRLFRRSPSRLPAVLSLGRSRSPRPWLRWLGVYRPSRTHGFFHHLDVLLADI